MVSPPVTQYPMKIVVENGKKVPKFYVHGNWISRSTMRKHRKADFDFEAENKAEAETKAKVEVKDLQIMQQQQEILQLKQVMDALIISL